MIFGHLGHSSRGEITEDGSREQHHPSNKDIIDLIHKPEYTDIPERKERRDKGHHKSKEHREDNLLLETLSRETGRHESKEHQETGRHESKEHRDKGRHKSEDYGITGRHRSHQKQRKPQEQSGIINTIKEQSGIIDTINGNDFAKQTKTKSEKNFNS